MWLLLIVLNKLILLTNHIIIKNGIIILEIIFLYREKFVELSKNILEKI